MQRFLFVRSFAGSFHLLSFVGVFFRALFCEWFYRGFFLRGGLFLLFLGHVLPCGLSQWRYPWAHHSELFACVSLQSTFPCALLQWFFQCVFLGLLPCTFPQNHSVCAL